MVAAVASTTLVEEVEDTMAVEVAALVEAVAMSSNKVAAQVEEGGETPTSPRPVFATMSMNEMTE